MDYNERPSTKSDKYLAIDHTIMHIHKIHVLQIRYLYVYRGVCGKLNIVRDDSKLDFVFLQSLIFAQQQPRGSDN